MQRTALLSLALMLTTACTVPYAGESGDITEHESEAAPVDAFDEAAQTFGVPSRLLQAIAMSETGMQMVTGAEEFEGRGARFGMMALSEDIVPEAATLAGVTEEAARFDRKGNILAAAALLDAWANEEAINRADLGAWAPVVARYSGIEDEGAQAFYVHDEVYPALQQGVSLEGLIGESMEVTPTFPAPVRPVADGDRSWAVYRPSPNNSARPSGASGDPTFVVIHTCEGSYSGCWSWLKNSSSGVSAHYVVNPDGSEVTQLVRDHRKAWHISARYDCSRNDNIECWRNNRSSNDFTIGIEHAGYGNQSSWHPGLLASSARLSCETARENGIPRDAYHIVGHGQLQPWNRSDPGPNWPWASYLDQVRSICDGGSPTPTPGPSPTPGGTAGTVVVDSNNAYNNSSTGSVTVGSAWRSSQSVNGYYNTGYWWRSTGSANDAAKFRANVSTPGCYAVDAWWTAATDRSRTAPFSIFGADGAKLASVNVDQTIGGGQWNQLGVFNLDAGWQQVELSSNTSAGKVVVADAVRVRPATGCAGVTDPGTDPGTTDPGTDPGTDPVDDTLVNLIIDSDDSQNGPGSEVTFSGNWERGDSTPGFYGTDYLWQETGPSSDPVTFAFELNTPRRLKVEARWPAGTNRSTHAPFVMRDADENVLGTAYVDQTQHDNTWVDLGTFEFGPGWNEVKLSRWAPEGAVVVADAVRVTELP